MSSNILDILVLMGALQGFIISAMLIWSKKKVLPDRLLGSLLFFMSLASLNIYLINQSWFTGNQTLSILHEIIPLVIFMPAGPLIYFYQRSYFEKDFKLGRREKRQFYPVIIDLFPHLLVTFYILGMATGLLGSANGALGRFIDDFNTYSDIPRWVSLGIYTWLSWRYLRSINLKMNRQSRLLTGWPGQLILAFWIFIGIWFIHLVPYLIPSLSERFLNLVGWYPIYIPGTVLIYWLSIKAYQLIFTRNKPTEKSSLFFDSIPRNEIDQAIGRLKNSMEREKLYLNPELNLQGLAAHTALPPKLISAILNQELKKNFSAFVNEYRIAELQSRMIQPEHNHMTLAGIAFDCGFNSQPTFQRAFKAATGKTPSEYMNSLHQIGK